MSFKCNMVSSEFHSYMKWSSFSFGQLCLYVRMKIPARKNISSIPKPYVRHTDGSSQSTSQSACLAIHFPRKKSSRVKISQHYSTNKIKTKKSSLFFLCLHLVAAAAATAFLVFHAHFFLRKNRSFPPVICRQQSLSQKEELLL